MGMYLQRIAASIPKSLGERPHGFKLNDPGFFEESFDTEHGQFLKTGVEKVIEKLEILSSVTSKNKKFKIKAEQRLDRLEAAMITQVTKNDFGFEMQKAEARIGGYVREQIVKQTDVQI